MGGDERSVRGSGEEYDGRAMKGNGMDFEMCPKGGSGLRKCGESRERMMRKRRKNMLGNERGNERTH